MASRARPLPLSLIVPWGPPLRSNVETPLAPLNLKPIGVEVHPAPACRGRARDRAGGSFDPRQRDAPDAEPGRGAGARCPEVRRRDGAFPPCPARAVARVGARILEHDPRAAVLRRVGALLREETSPTHPKAGAHTEQGSHVVVLPVVTHAPAPSHSSTVQRSASLLHALPLGAAVPGWQKPPLQTSSTVHSLPSSHSAVLSGWVQVPAPSHRSAVQPLPSVAHALPLGSKWQVPERRSASLTVPASQSSPASIRPLPQRLPVNGPLTTMGVTPKRHPMVPEIGRRPAWRCQRWPPIPGCKLPQIPRWPRTRRSSG